MSLVERDGRVVWHPYTQARTAPPPVAIAGAHGAWLVAEDGSRYLDAISSWWVNVHGHGHPRLVAAMARQARDLDHVAFAGATHAPAVELAERLCALLGLDKVFYSDDGSTAVEVALKVALQYWQNVGAPRTRFLALPNAYHGDTVGAMSASGVPLFRDAYRPFLFRVERYDGVVDDDVAAVLVEPMVQGAAGMRVHEAASLREIERRCREAGALLVADEVMTGFGRTGRMFACEHAGVRPDVVCVAKGITGGLLPLAATVVSARVHETFLSEDRGRALFHGHSYTANPIACAVALESLRLFDEGPVLERANRIGARVRGPLERLRGRVEDVRGLGAIQAVELAGEAGYLAEVGPRMTAAALRRGVLLRPLGNVLYAMPPFCLTDDEATRLGEVLVEVVEETRTPA